MHWKIFRLCHKHIQILLKVGIEIVWSKTGLTIQHTRYFSHCTSNTTYIRIRAHDQQLQFYNSGKISQCLEYASAVLQSTDSR